MKKISVIAALLLCSLSLFAVPAKPGKIRYTQPDGSVIEIVKHGDEWGHWTTNAAGKVVEMDKDGFYREVPDLTPEMAAQAASIRRSAKLQLRKQRHNAPAGIAIGQKKFLVILVQFQNVSFKSQNNLQAFKDMLNKPGYSDNDGTGSARDYYYDNSHGVFEPVFDVFGPFTVSQNMSYYGGNTSSGDDSHPEEAVIEGCRGLDNQINFADYDNDADGYLDLVYMVYAGKGEADGGAADTIWPHQWEISNAGYYGNNAVVLDGKTIDKYACGSELNGDGVMTGIGTMCHEFGHAMGLPDFYDTNYTTNGEAHGLAFFSLMDAGSYNNDGRTPPYLNIEERILLGWLDSSVLEEFPKNGSYSLASVDNNKAYKIPTDQEGEYFVLECRDNTGWDSGIYGAYGMVAYHVDKSARIVGGGISAFDLWDKWQQTNMINAYGSHPCFYVIPACDQTNLNYQFSYVDDVWAMLFPGHADLSTKVTSYAPKSWNSVNTDISLSGISYSAGIVSFTVSGVVSSSMDYPYIANPGKGVYEAGSAFALEVVTPGGDEPSEVVWKMDGAAVSGPSVTLTSGSHKFDASVTLSDGKTYAVTLELKAL